MTTNAEAINALKAMLKKNGLDWVQDQINVAIAEEKTQDKIVKGRKYVTSIPYDEGEILDIYISAVNRLSDLQAMKEVTEGIIKNSLKK